MYRYRVYGVTVESEFEISPLIPLDVKTGATEKVYQDKLISDSVPITVSEQDVECEVKHILEQVGGLERKYEIGKSVSAFFNRGGYYLIKNGTEILVKIREGYEYNTVSAWILGFALSMALLQRKVLTIHCSAVTVNNQAVLISGIPGAGKSSLARRLIESGFGLMADDVAAVRFGYVSQITGPKDGSDRNEVCMVYPSFPFQKLCSNEIMERGLDLDKLIYINEDKDKYLVPVPDIFVDSPQKLSFFFFIVEATVEKLMVERISGLNCLFTVQRNLFLHRLPGEWEKDPNVINACMSLASKCKMYLVVRPQGQDTLDEIKERVISIVNDKKH